MKLKKHNLIFLGLAIGLGLSSAWLSQAQTWFGPYAVSPNNQRCQTANCDTFVDVEDINERGGDNLGDHIAEQTLDMAGYAITGVVSATDGEHALDFGTDFWGLTVDGDNTYPTDKGILAENNSASFAAVDITQNHASGLALRVSTAGSIYSTLINGRLWTEDELLIGTASDNDKLSSAAGLDAASSLYWGNTLVCPSPDQPLCGFADDVSDLDDNLGNLDPHTAYKDLDMAGWRIYNIGSGLNPANNALEIFYTGASLVAGSQIVNQGNGGLASTALAGTTNDPGFAGVYGDHQANGTGIRAHTAGITVAQFSGRVDLSGANDGLAFRGNTGLLGRLITSAGSAPSADLYWGDKLLCDGSAPSCGIGAIINIPDK